VKLYAVTRGMAGGVRCVKVRQGAARSGKARFGLAGEAC